jgi:hypothetical protein
MAATTAMASRCTQVSTTMALMPPARFEGAGQSCRSAVASMSPAAWLAPSVELGNHRSGGAQASRPSASADAFGRRCGLVELPVGQADQRLRGSARYGLRARERIDALAIRAKSPPGARIASSSPRAWACDSSTTSLPRPCRPSSSRFSRGGAAQVGEGWPDRRAGEVARDGGEQDLLELLVDPADECCFMPFSLPARLDHEHVLSSSGKFEGAG